MRTWNFAIGATTHTVQIAHDPIFSGELEIYVDGEQRVNQITPRGRNFEYKCEIEGKPCLVQITYSSMSAGGFGSLSCAYDVLIDGQSQKYSGVQDLVSPPAAAPVPIAEGTRGDEKPSPTVDSPEEKVEQDEESEPKSWSLNELKTEDQTVVADLINLGSDEPDARYKAYKILDQKRYDDEKLLETLARLETEIPASEVITRIRLYCGLGTWLGGNIYTRPKGIELIKQAIKLATEMALPHVLLGTLLMGDSSNAYLERQSGSARQFSGLSPEDLGLLSQAYHEDAKKELELAISINPKDASPYYIFCLSQFLDFTQLKKYYRLGIGQDKTHSPEFGRYHWGYAIKAARFNQGNEATEAFLRAMLVEPQEYCEGPRAVRPQSGLALSCWQTAKQQVGSYQNNPIKLEALWSAEPATKHEPPKPAPIVQPKAEVSEPASGSSKASKRSTKLLRWTIIIVGGFLCVCLGLAWSGPKIAALLPVGTETPLQSTATMVVPTATSTPIPWTPTALKGTPIIHSVVLRPTLSSGNLVIYQDVYFSDTEGDVIRWDFKVVSSTVSDVHAEGGYLDISATEQRSGAVATGEWSCGNENYSVTLSVTFTDRAGHQSDPYEYTMECTGN